MVLAPKTLWKRSGPGASRWLSAWLLCSLAACSLDRDPAEVNPGVPTQTGSPAPAIGNDASMAQPIGNDAGASQTPRVPDAGRPEPAAPVPTHANGEACTGAAQCTSGHCDMGLCCDRGRCCTIADQCRQTGAMEAACDQPSDCQGTRGEVICQDFQCATRDGVADDRACDATIEADECGAFLPVFCNGRSDQQAPTCPTSCISDQECDPAAHCDGTCQPDVANGEACEEDGDCTSGHCAAGICCSSGDCCRLPRDCLGYGTPPTCVDRQACQGMRTEATCTDFVCGSMMAQDDSGCGRGIPAQSCGLFRDVTCNGAVTQTATCVFTCTTDQQCDADSHCNGGDCTPDLRDGANCQEPSDCQSGHCDSAICCSGEDCCARDSDCRSAISCNERTFVCEAEDRPPQSGAGSGGGSGRSG